MSRSLPTIQPVYPCSPRTFSDSSEYRLRPPAESLRGRTTIANRSWIRNPLGGHQRLSDKKGALRQSLFALDKPIAKILGRIRRCPPYASQTNPDHLPRSHNIRDHSPKTSITSRRTHYQYSRSIMGQVPIIPGIMTKLPEHPEPIPEKTGSNTPKP